MQLRSLNTVLFVIAIVPTSGEHSVLPCIACCRLVDVVDVTKLFVIGGCSCDVGTSDQRIYVVYVNASTVNVASHNICHYRRKLHS